MFNQGETAPLKVHLIDLIHKFQTFHCCAEYLHTHSFTQSTSLTLGSTVYFKQL